MLGDIALVKTGPHAAARSTAAGKIQVTNKRLFACFTCVRNEIFVLISNLTHRPAYQMVTYIECYIPDDVLIQLILLTMSTGLLETWREVK
jgi:hypothetical protein